MTVNEFLSDRRRSATGTIALVEVLDSGGGRPTPASPTSIQLGLKVVRPAFQGQARELGAVVGEQALRPAATDVNALLVGMARQRCSDRKQEHAAQNRGPAKAWRQGASKGGP